MVRFAVLSCCMLLSLLLASPCFSGVQSSRLLMPDGQLISQPVRVFVSPGISAKQQPRLWLLGKQSAGKQPEKKEDYFLPYAAVENQQWEEAVNGQKTFLEGTLLLFDLHSYGPIRRQAMKRVTPILQWKTGADASAWNEGLVGDEVNLGNGTMVFFYTLAVVAAAVGLVLWTSKSAKGNAIYLITGADGHLSLSRTQMALWTLSIGAVVFGCGLFQRKVPEIPETLLALMGLSLATTGISYVKVAGAAGQAPGAASSAQKAAPVPVAPRLGDLVSVSRTATPAKDLSIAKAQMLFWTGLVLVLFLAKSILDAALWAVPWEMVALMGMSQAGYLGPKFVSGPQPGPQSS